MSLCVKENLRMDIQNKTQHSVACPEISKEGGANPWAPAGGGKRGHLPPPWKFKNMGGPPKIT